MPATCGSCGAEIWWCITTNGQNMPVNAKPVPDGNVAVHRDPDGQLRSRVLKAGEEPAPWEHRATSHHATCPNADQHRKKSRTWKRDR